MVGRRKRVRFLVAGLVAVGVVTATYGFTAANTVPASKAGDGTGTVSGYTVSAIDYTLDATDPGLIDKVNFTLDSDPGTGEVRANVDDIWVTCSNVTTAVTCDWADGTEPTVLGATALRVVVAQ